jgi:hypothetical protein
MAKSLASEASRPATSHCFGQRLRRDVLTDGGVQHFLAELDDGVANVLGRQQAVAHVVDHLALLVGHVVVFEQLLADVEVAAFDLALRLLDGVGDHAVLDGLADCMPRAFMKFFTRSEAKMRIRLSSSDR